MRTSITTRFSLADCSASTDFKHPAAYFLPFLTLKVLVIISRHFVLPYTIKNQMFQIISQEAGRPSCHKVDVICFSSGDYIACYGLVYRPNGEGVDDLVTIFVRLLV
jgi:hypothetical protein